VGDKLMAGMAGKIRINSTSKIRKIKATQKKRIEKGRRAENLGVNPHSKGLVFSKSVMYLNLQTLPKIRRIADKIKVNSTTKEKKIKNSILMAKPLFLIYKI
jgi:hypothetical protein